VTEPGFCTRCTEGSYITALGCEFPSSWLCILGTPLVLAESNTASLITFIISSLSTLVIKHSPRSSPRVRAHLGEGLLTSQFRRRFSFQILSRMAMPLRPRHSGSYMFQLCCHQEIVESACMKIFHNAR
jgi:hypothetical protein